MTSYYCRKCELLIDESEVKQVTDTLFVHVKFSALTSDGALKEITHEVIKEP